MGFGGPRVLVVGGKRLENGIAVSGGAETAYDIQGLYGEFAAAVAVDDSTPEGAKLEFVVLGDGREIWKSGPLGKTDSPKPVRAEIPGVRRLGLKVAVVEAGAPPAADRASGAGRGRPRPVQGDWLGPVLGEKVKAEAK